MSSEYISDQRTHLRIGIGIIPVFGADGYNVTIVILTGVDDMK